jgi:hypothetical protein
VRRPDLAALISGLAVVVLGGVLLLDRAGGLTLDFGTFGPLVFTVLGVILLVTGLARQEGGT